VTLTAIAEDSGARLITQVANASDIEGDSFGQCADPSPQAMVTGGQR
jgi:hypothetical protein